MISLMQLSVLLNLESNKTSRVSIKVASMSEIVEYPTPGHGGLRPASEDRDLAPEDNPRCPV
jgi:hypothetical protein